MEMINDEGTRRVLSLSCVLATDANRGGQMHRVLISIEKNKY